MRAQRFGANAFSTMYSYSDEDRFSPASAAQAAAPERAAFIRKTYWHLALALLAFVGAEALLLHSPLAAPLAQLMLGGTFSWLIVLVLFMIATWVGDKWARNNESVAVQYAGLALYVVIYTVITMPLLLVAETYAPDSIVSAAVMTLALFFGLTSTVFITRKDFSFLGPIVSLGCWIALGVIVAGILFGFTLGLFFSVAMVALVAGCILFTTSNILHVYRTDQYVAASLQLFASIITMFWYILQIFMSRR